MTQAHETQALTERPKDVIERTAARVHEMLTAGELTLPDGYAWRNAITGAWLWLQDATIQSGQHKGEPILKHVTTASVANALMAMVTQGLAVHRKQGYLIPYGKVLTFQRSVFGTVTIARREAGLIDAIPELILEGDTFTYRIDGGRKIITEHAQSFEALRVGTIVGAYAHLTFTDATRDRAEVMTWDEIQASWKQSKQATYDTSPHRRFAGEMAKRTVVNRALKLLVNAATDDAHLLDAFNRDEVADDDLETIDVEAAPDPTAEQAAEVADVAEAAPEETAEELDVEYFPELEPEPGDDARLFPEDPGF